MTTLKELGWEVDNFLKMDEPELKDQKLTWQINGDEAFVTDGKGTIYCENAVEVKR